MNINLDDNKIVLIRYKINDETTVDFEYNNSELESIKTNKISSETSCTKKVLSDREMINTIKSTMFKQELDSKKDDEEKNVNTSQLSKACRKLDEIASNSKESVVSKPIEKDFNIALNQNKELEKEQFERLKDNNEIKNVLNLIKLDNEGKLDKIANNSRSSIENILFDYKNTKSETVDLSNCNKCLDTIKTKIIDRYFDDLIAVAQNTKSDELKELIELYNINLKKKRELLDFLS